MDRELRDYMDMRFREQREWFMDLRGADEQQRDLLRKEMERRLESMNEFREQLRSQTNTFVSREAFDLNTANSSKAINDLEKWKANIEGRMMMLISIPIAISMLSAIAMLLITLTQG